MDSSRMDSDTVSMYDYQLILNQLFLATSIFHFLKECEGRGVNKMKTSSRYRFTLTDFLISR